MTRKVCVFSLDTTTVSLTTFSICTSGADFRISVVPPKSAPVLVIASETIHCKRLRGRGSGAPSRGQMRKFPFTQKQSARDRLSRPPIESLSLPGKSIVSTLLNGGGLEELKSHVHSLSRVRNGLALVGNLEPTHKALPTPSRRFSTML